MSNYPVVKIPNELAEIYMAIPPLPNFPIRPNEPVKPIKAEEPKYLPPIKPIKGELTNYNSSLLVVVISGFILYCLFEVKTKDMPPIFIIIVGLVFLGSLFSIYAVYSNNSKELDMFDTSMNRYLKETKTYESTYSELISKWKESINLINKKYSNDLDTYQKILLPAFEQDLHRYEIEKLRIQTINNLIVYRNKLFSEFTKKSSNYNNHKSIHKLSKGVTEDLFFKRLNKEIFLKSCVINVTPDIDIDNSYLPDITLVLNSGIKIDIEIDEPYIGSSGKPIHYLHNTKDYKRDSFFLSKGWIVIRFAEKQIIEDVDNCVAVIKNIEIALQNFERPLTEQNLIGDIVTLKHWTEQEAHEMAFGRYRNRYLNIELTEKIRLEYEESEKYDTISEKISYLEINKSENINYEYNNGQIRNTQFDKVEKGNNFASLIKYDNIEKKKPVYKEKSIQQYEDDLPF